MFLRSPLAIVILIIILVLSLVISVVVFKTVKPVYSFSTLHFVQNAMRKAGMGSLAQIIHFFIKILKITFFTGGIICLGILFMRPAVESKQTNEDEALDIITVIDGSGSMEATDISPTRFDAARQVLLDFINKAEQDRIGVIYFSVSATTAAPLTTDYQMLRAIIESITLKNIYSYFDYDTNPSAGTVIGDALLLATQRFPEDHKYKVAIIISDGENNGGYDPEKAASYAKKKGIIVYTIYIGDSYYGEGGKTLKRIAEISGGKYYTAKDQTTISDIFQNISQIEKNKIVLYSNSIIRDQPETFFILSVIFILGFIILKYTEELWN